MAVWQSTKQRLDYLSIPEEEITERAATTESMTHCIRCVDGALKHTAEEKSCLACGWVQYYTTDEMKPESTRQRKRGYSDLPYVGSARIYTWVPLRLVFKRQGDKVIRTYYCPLFAEPSSSKREGNRCNRKLVFYSTVNRKHAAFYICAVGHHIHLVNDRSAWRFPHDG